MLSAMHARYISAHDWHFLYGDTHNDVAFWWCMFPFIIHRERGAITKWTSLEPICIVGHPLQFGFLHLAWLFMEEVSCITDGRNHFTEPMVARLLFLQTGFFLLAVDVVLLVFM